MCSHFAFRHSFFCDSLPLWSSWSRPTFQYMVNGAMYDDPFDRSHNRYEFIHKNKKSEQQKLRWTCVAHVLILRSWRRCACEQANEHGRARGHTKKKWETKLMWFEIEISRHLIVVVLAAFAFVCDCFCDDCFWLNCRRCCIGLELELDWIHQALATV